jgi:hypothetical protein
MRENRSYGSVGVRGGNEPLYPDGLNLVYGAYTTDHRLREIG